MRVIWEKSPIPANEVVERLGPLRGWSPTTVKTMLNRLVRKSALAFEAEGKRYLYRPRVTRDQCVRLESRSFLDRVFGGAAAPMLDYFVKNTRLSAKEIAELRRILSKKGK